MIRVVRLDASNLLHDGSLTPIVSNQVDELRCHASSHPQPAVVLQCDVSTRTMIDVSDRIADIRDGQSEVDTELDLSHASPNKAVQPSAQSSGLFRDFVTCSHWLTANVIGNRTRTECKLRPNELTQQTCQLTICYCSTSFSTIAFPFIICELKIIHPT